jgi:spore coat polysaccharide biosynthesis protein SpsF
MVKRAAIILARLDSRRFPNKALSLIREMTIIEYSINALQNLKDTDIVLATTERNIDDPLTEIAAKNHISLFRGNTDNVAKRVLDCIQALDISFFARINGDSPFVRKELLEEAFNILEKTDYDFVTNLVPRTYPYGISVEVFRASIYQEAFPKFSKERYTEHVTTYFYDHIDDFNPFYMNYSSGDQHDIRLVIDTPEDKVRIEKLMMEIENPNSVPLEMIIQVYRKLKL